MGWEDKTREEEGRGENNRREEKRRKEERTDERVGHPANRGRGVVGRASPSCMQKLSYPHRH